MTIDTTKRDALLQAWETAKTQLDNFKELEMSARLAVVEYLADPEIAKGTETIKLENGFRLTINKKINYKIDETKIGPTLDKIVTAGEDGKLMADNVVKWKPELSQTFYNTMPTEYRQLIQEAIITTPGTPTIEIKGPTFKARGKSVIE